ncbi:uncharacterized protein LOC116945039 isoform X2 [Petromyzon marinus]|uniref:uncharacterized protein LOC116945039 isoform X2 n=1 Tax=Petromyzon marinus TaxID=7757 RepID=UPI003F717417
MACNFSIYKTFLLIKVLGVVTCQQELSTINVDVKMNTMASLPCGRDKSAEPSWVVWFRAARGARGQPVPVALCSEKEAFIPSCDRDGGGASEVGRLCCSGSGGLTIRRVEAGDTGTYTCVTGALLGQHVCNNSLTVCKTDLWNKSQISKRYYMMTIQLLIMNSLKTYLIHVYTGIEDKAGTDEAVSITIHGSAVNPAMDLTSSKTHNNPFERNQKDTFILISRDIGNITRVTVSHGGAWYKPLSAWNLDKIEVEDEESHTTFVFPLNRWIDGESRDLHAQEIIVNNKSFVYDSQFQNNTKEKECTSEMDPSARYSNAEVTKTPWLNTTSPAVNKDNQDAKYYLWLVITLILVIIALVAFAAFLAHLYRKRHASKDHLQVHCNRSNTQSLAVQPPCCNVDLLRSGNTQASSEMVEYSHGRHQVTPEVATASECIYSLVGEIETVTHLPLSTK